MPHPRHAPALRRAAPRASALALALLVACAPQGELTPPTPSAAVGEPMSMSEETDVEARPTSDAATEVHAAAPGSSARAAADTDAASPSATSSEHASADPGRANASASASDHKRASDSAQSTQTSSDHKSASARESVSFSERHTADQADVKVTPRRP